MRPVLFFLLLLVLAAQALLLLRAEPGLPAIRVMTTCDEAEEKPELIPLADFAEKHQGEVVYVEFGIEATDHAGSCAIEGAAARETEKRPPSSLDPVNPEGGWARDGFDLVLSMPYEAGTLDIALVDAADVPVGGPFVARRDFYRYFLAGPVIIRHETGNGFRGVSLYPAENATALAGKVMCAKRGLDSLLSALTWC
jgi:hypothetical protein